nr:short chain dehydrogenase mdpc [Quercus suber]
MVKGSHIVLLSTTLTKASTAQPAYLLYNATKGAIEQMTRVLCKDLGRKGIFVNAVAPGPTGTELFYEGKSPEILKMIANFNPQGRIGTPEEIAESIVYLSGSSWISGQVVAVNGDIRLSELDGTGRILPGSFGRVTLRKLLGSLAPSLSTSPVRLPYPLGVFNDEYLSNLTALISSSSTTYKYRFDWPGAPSYCPCYKFTDCLYVGKGQGLQLASYTDPSFRVTEGRYQLHNGCFYQVRGQEDELGCTLKFLMPYIQRSVQTDQVLRLAYLSEFNCGILPVALLHCLSAASFREMDRITLISLPLLVRWQIYRELIGLELHIELLPDGRYTADVPLFLVNREFKYDLMAAFSTRQMSIIWTFKSPAALLNNARVVLREPPVRVIQLNLLASLGRGLQLTRVERLGSIGPNVSPLCDAWRDAVREIPRNLARAVYVDMDHPWTSRAPSAAMLVHDLSAVLLLHRGIKHFHIVGCETQDGQRLLVEKPYGVGEAEKDLGLDIDQEFDEFSSTSDEGDEQDGAAAPEC